MEIMEQVSLGTMPAKKVGLAHVSKMESLVMAQSLMVRAMMATELSFVHSMDTATRALVSLDSGRAGRRALSWTMPAMLQEQYD